MAKEPYLIRQDKPTRDARETGVFYLGNVMSVRNDGRVNVRIPALSMTMGPIMVLNSVPLVKGDTVVCTFSDSSNNSLIVFGALNKKIDTDLNARNEKIKFLMEIF